MCCRVVTLTRLLTAIPLPPPLPTITTQLARIYREVKEGLATNRYVPAALYSCEEHLVGPSLASLEEAVQGGWA